jgi:hypothetical protein
MLAAGVSRGSTWLNVGAAITANGFASLTLTPGIYGGGDHHGDGGLCGSNWRIDLNPCPDYCPRLSRFVSPIVSRQTPPPT